MSQSETTPKISEALCYSSVIPGWSYQQLRRTFRMMHKTLKNQFSEKSTDDDVPMEQGGQPSKTAPIQLDSNQTLPNGLTLGQTAMIWLHDHHQSNYKSVLKKRGKPIEILPAIVLK